MTKINEKRIDDRLAILFMKRKLRGLFKEEETKMDKLSNKSEWLCFESGFYNALIWLKEEGIIKR